MTEPGSDAPHHRSGKKGCRCVISGSTLALVRRRRLLSIEAVASGSIFSQEHLAGVEGGDRGKCADLAVIDAYEEAMDTTMEEVLALLITQMAQAALQMRDTIHRLSKARRRKTR